MEGNQTQSDMFDTLLDRKSQTANFAEPTSRSKPQQELQLQFKSIETVTQQNLKT